jgi:hypothetical protein
MPLGSSTARPWPHGEGLLFDLKDGDSSDFQKKSGWLIRRTAKKKRQESTWFQLLHQEQV